jgi:thioredoxin 1
VVRPVQDDRPDPGRDRHRAAGKVKVVKLNVDENQETARRFDVMSIPTLIVFKDGKPAKKMIGAKGKGALLEDLAEFL